MNPGGGVDLAAVREARARLADLARDFPELTGPSGPDNAASWEETLRADEEESMVPNKPRTMTEHTAIRLPPELLERVDAYRDGVEAASGFKPGRADVFRKALEEFLDAHEKSAKRRG